MTAPFIGEIRIFGFNFAPVGWARCDGSFVSISQNTALFSILGTTYGGNGQTTFALPNLLGRVPVGAGSGPGLPAVALGESLGTNSVTLTANQIPQHNHTLNAGILSAPNPAQNVATPSATAFLGLSGPNNTYSDAATANTTMHPGALSTVGGGQAHENRQPFVATNICIAVFGIFPSRN